MHAYRASQRAKFKRPFRRTQMRGQVKCISCIGSIKFSILKTIFSPQHMWFFYNGREFDFCFKLNNNIVQFKPPVKLKPIHIAILQKSPEVTPYFICYPFLKLYRAAAIGWYLDMCERQKHQPTFVIHLKKYNHGYHDGFYHIVHQDQSIGSPDIVQYLSDHFNIYNAYTDKRLLTLRMTYMKSKGLFSKYLASLINTYDETKVDPISKKLADMINTNM